jgi:hypothetical protein
VSARELANPVIRPDETSAPPVPFRDLWLEYVSGALLAAVTLPWPLLLAIVLDHPVGQIAFFVLGFFWFALAVQARGLSRRERITWIAVLGVAGVVASSFSWHVLDGALRRSQDPARAIARKVTQEIR